MISLNSFLVDARARTSIAGAERENEAEIDASRAGRAGAGILATSIALGLTDGGVVVFGSEETELLEWEDL